MCGVVWYFVEVGWGGVGYINDTKTSQSQREDFRRILLNVLWMQHIWLHWVEFKRYRLLFYTRVAFRCNMCTMPTTGLVDSKFYWQQDSTNSRTLATRRLQQQEGYSDRNAPATARLYWQECSTASKTHRLQNSQTYTSVPFFVSSFSRRLSCSLWSLVNKENIHFIRWLCDSGLSILAESGNYIVKPS